MHSSYAVMVLFWRGTEFVLLYEDTGFGFVRGLGLGLLDHHLNEHSGANANTQVLLAPELGQTEPRKTIGMLMEATNQHLN